MAVTQDPLQYHHEPPDSFPLPPKGGRQPLQMTRLGKASDDEAITKDNVTISIDGVLYLKVVDAYQAADSCYKTPKGCLAGWFFTLNNNRLKTSKLEGAGRNPFEAKILFERAQRAHQKLNLE